MRETNTNLSLGGAFFAAIGSCLCCLLPVLAMSFGVGAFGFVSGFESLRPYLLAVSFLALGFAFYKTYFRRGECAEDEACTKKPIGRINQMFLWGTALGIVAFASFPYYSGYIVSAISSGQPETQNNAAAQNNAQNRTVIIEVEGMTCEGCASHIDATLKNLKGVISAKASYKNKNVKVVYNPKQITLKKIKQAISKLGYTSK